MQIGGYSIGGWLFLAFIIFLALYPIYAMIRYIVDNRRDGATKIKPAAYRSTATASMGRSAPHAGSEPPRGDARKRERGEVRDLVFRREFKSRGSGVFTLGYPNPLSGQGREWIAGSHQWFPDNASRGNVLPEMDLNASAISFIRKYYPD
ncbi:MAG: hypothetical protein VB093_16295, partial [Propionicimonas sp.]|nr:hypothetical protein [Propionicimonas sp.]